MTNEEIRDWFAQNEDSIKEVLPQTWTLMDNMDTVRIAFRFKLLGLDWRTVQDFGRLMVMLEKLGIMQRQNGFQIRANPDKVFG